MNHTGSGGPLQKGVSARRGVMRHFFTELPVSLNYCHTPHPSRRIRERRLSRDGSRDWLRRTLHGFASLYVSRWSRLGVAANLLFTMTGTGNCFIIASGQAFLCGKGEGLPIRSAILSFPGKRISRSITTPRSGRSWRKGRPTIGLCRTIFSSPPRSRPVRREARSQRAIPSP